MNPANTSPATKWAILIGKSIFQAEITEYEPWRIKQLGLPNRDIFLTREDAVSEWNKRLTEYLQVITEELSKWSPPVNETLKPSAGLSPLQRVYLAKLIKRKLMHHAYDSADRSSGQCWTIAHERMDALIYPKDSRKALSDAVEKFTGWLLKKMPDSKAKAPEK